MAEFPETRKVRLVWLLTVFLLVAFCGCAFHWINYRVVKVVDEYERQRTHVSRIHPAPPLWTREEAMKIRLWKLKQSGGYLEDESMDYSQPEPRQSQQDYDEILKPEVVKWKAPKNVSDFSTWKGTKPPRKSRRRMPPLSSNDVIEERRDSHKRVSIPSSTVADSNVLPVPSTIDRLETTTPMSVKSDLTEIPSLSTESDLIKISTLSSLSAVAPSSLEKTTTKESLAEQSEAIIKVTVSPDAKKQEDVTENIAALNATWQSPHLLNISNFTWLMNNESFCKMGKSLTRLLVVLVHTSRTHFNARQAIRNSWGSIPAYKIWRIRVAFLLGEAGPEVSQEDLQEQTRKLKAEQEKYGDLVMGSFIDSYKNLSYKHLMGFKWILNYCQNASFILKVNDNIFVDITKWIDWLNPSMEILKEKEASTATQQLTVPDFYCKVKSDMKPDREGKLSVSQEEWPLEKYPDYCHRWAYGASVDALRKLYSVSNKAKYFWRDEIFVTGVLKNLANKLYGWKSETKDISNFVSPKNVSTQRERFRKLCEKGDWKDKWPDYPIIYLQRGENLEMDMICLWSKILHVKLSNSKNDDQGKKIETTEHIEDGEDE